MTAPASLAVERLETTGDLGEQWDALADLVGAPPWQRPGWLEAWWRAFGRGRPLVLVARDGERLAGVMPLVRHGAELRSWSNYHTPSFGVLADGEASRTAILAAALAQPDRRVSLYFVRRDDPLGAGWLAATAAAGRLGFARVLERSPYISTAVGWEAYERSLRGHLLREIRRRRRKLEAEGSVAFTVDDGRADLDGRLAETFRVEAAGWKGERGTAIASSPETLRFYREVAAWAAERGSLRLTYLRLDDRAIAVDLAIEEGGVHYLLKTGFDPRYRTFAPGSILRHEVLRRVFASGLAEYEFLGADDEWKLEWTSERCDHLLLQAFARSPGGALDWAAQRHGRPVARRVVPAVRGVVPAVRGAVPAARRLVRR